MRVLIFILCLVFAGCTEVDYKTVLQNYEWICLKNNDQGKCNYLINVKTAKDNAAYVDFWVRSDLDGPQIYSKILPTGKVQKSKYTTIFYKLQTNCNTMQLSRPAETIFLNDKSQNVAKFEEASPKFHPVEAGSTEDLDLTFACKYFEYANDKEKYALLKMIESDVTTKKTADTASKPLVETIKTFKTKAEKRADEERKANH